MASFSQMTKQMSTFHNELPAGKKVALWVVVTMVLVGLSAMVHIANKPDFRLLFSNLNAEDAGLVVGKLKELRLPYKVTQGGRTILIPDQQVDEVRLQLASQGLPRGEGAGFEIFDKSSPWSTGFVQELNFLRALQGELARSISSLDEVEWARVHIAKPRESLFIEEEKPATASVVIKVRMGRRLDRNQIAGVVHLVAGSVEGLKPNNVTLLDNSGNILSGQNDDADTGQFATNKLEMQEKMELGLQKRLQSMLDRSLGKDRSVVQVNMDIDFSKVEKTEEIYDPDNTVVRSERRTTETSKGAGITGSSGDGAANGASGGTEYQKKNETVEYEVSRVVHHITKPVGNINRMYVAVLIDGRYETSEDGEDTYISRTPEEIRVYENLLKKASGFNSQRGDQLEIANIQFDTSPRQDSVEVPRPATMAEKLRIVSLLAQKYLVKIVLFILFFVFMVRPLIKWLTSQESRPVRTGESGVEAAGETDDVRIEWSARKELPSKEQAQELARSDPVRAAAIARKWLNE